MLRLSDSLAAEVAASVSRTRPTATVMPSGIRRACPLGTPTVPPLAASAPPSGLGGRSFRPRLSHSVPGLGTPRPPAATPADAGPTPPSASSAAGPWRDLGAHRRPLAAWRSAAQTPLAAGCRVALSLDGEGAAGIAARSQQAACGLARGRDAHGLSMGRRRGASAEHRPPARDAGARSRPAGAHRRLGAVAAGLRPPCWAHPMGCRAAGGAGQSARTWGAPSTLPARVGCALAWRLGWPPPL